MNLKSFFKSDSASGVMLIFAAVLALVVNNVGFEHIYHEVLHTHMAFSIAGVGLDKLLAHWINDGLMAIFFLTVGLEIKRELVDGALKEVKQALLPFIAALGGVVFPALIYVGFNYADPNAAHGWGIPMATDIAFAVGVLSLLGDRVPKQLKIMLLSLAIIDDLIAIIVIAIFYTSNIHFDYLGYGAIAFGVLVMMNLNNVKNLLPYSLVGFVLWLCILESGVHATIAGVVLAFTIPLKIDGDEHASPLKRMEHKLYAWAAFVIMPIFAFANAGFSLGDVEFSSLVQPLSLGIILGLFFGKQIGVFSFVWIFDRIGFVKKPADASWKQIYGLAIITGIGFTVSLFIGSLAFTDQVLLSEVRLSVLLASTLSAVIGYLVLQAVSKDNHHHLIGANVNPIAHPEILREE